MEDSGNYFYEGSGNIDQYSDSMSTVPSYSGTGNRSVDWANGLARDQGLIDVSAMVSPGMVQGAGRLFGNMAHGMKTPMSWAEGMQHRGQLGDPGRRDAMKQMGVGAGVAAGATGVGMGANALVHSMPAMQVAKAPVSLAHLDARMSTLSGINTWSPLESTSKVMQTLAGNKASAIDDVLVQMSKGGIPVARRDPATGHYIKGSPDGAVEAGDISRHLGNPDRFPLPKGADPKLVEKARGAEAEFAKKQKQIERMQEKTFDRRHSAYYSEKPVLSPEEMKKQSLQIKADKQRYIDEDMVEMQYLDDMSPSEIASASKHKLDYFDGEIARFDSLMEELAKTGKYAKSVEPTNVLPF